MYDPFYAPQHRPYDNDRLSNEDTDRLRRSLNKKLADLDEEANANMSIMRQADDLLFEIQAELACASDEDIYRIGQLRDASFDDAQQLARQLEAEQEDANQKLHELNRREW